MSDDDLITMWRSFKAIAAIKSTYEVLRQVLQEVPDGRFHIGMVRYKDYDVDRIEGDDVLDVAFHKRLHFQDEREIRTMTWDPISALTEVGIDQPCDIDRLIQEVVISPDADDATKQQVYDLARACSLSAPIHTSRIWEPPDY